MVKATRGDVARILLSHDPVDTPEDVASLVRAAGLQVELTGSGRVVERRRARLTIAGPSKSQASTSVHTRPWLRS